MRKISVLLIITLVLGLTTSCGASDTANGGTDEAVETSGDTEESVEEEAVEEDVTRIVLSNSDILVNDEEISENPEDDVYKANDIIFYLEGQGIEYGEGTESDEHSQIEADAHTVVHITKPGTYELSGTMDAGQIFVDLGEDAKEDPEAVVTLILNGVDITCTVAPAIFFYNVYECAVTEQEDEAGAEDASLEETEEAAAEGTTEEEVSEATAAMETDTAAAGANLRIADDTTNLVYGSYVAKIYESCELNEEGTEVVESKKLHKYDGAVYSRMSMNVFGDTGSLAITAENEGLDTEMHLTIQGGNIQITSGNDGINTNADNESVFTMNGGSLKITVTGKTGEGDGIDSNGWLVINGGIVETYACASSMDSGLDSDKGIFINGGTVTASGNMLDEISDGEQTHAVFMSQEALAGGEVYEVRDGEDNVIMEVSPENDFTVLVVSSETLTEDATYTLWLDREQVAESTQGAMGFGGGRPDGMEPPEEPDGMEPPEGFDGERPEKPEEGKGADGQTPPQKPEKE